MRRLLLVLSVVLSVGCAQPRHVLVVLDQSLYEVLTDVSNAEQQALCQRDFCLETSATGGRSRIESPIAGWSVEKSIDFNQRLLPAVEAGRQFNQILGSWRPGTPLPMQVQGLITAVGGALVKVTTDFPDGTLKTRILAGLSRVQQIVLSAIDIYLSATASPASADPLRNPLRQP